MKDKRALRQPGFPGALYDFQEFVSQRKKSTVFILGNFRP